jgi:hypothetical protein
VRKRLDWDAVARARRRLDQIKHEHPELVGPADVEQWADTLAKDEAMADTQQVAFRLPADLVKRLDRHGKRLEEASPGMTFTRADVVRMLLTTALDQAEGQSRPRRK